LNKKTRVPSNPPTANFFFTRIMKVTDQANRSRFYVIKRVCSDYDDFKISLILQSSNLTFKSLPTLSEVIYLYTLPILISTAFHSLAILHIYIYLSM